MIAIVPNISTQYDAKTIEAKWQQYWEENQTFKANPQKGGDPYCIVIPPPNVTGTLHMGHAFNTALIDTLVRYHRMQGKNTLCLPGTDHASIAVQTLIEKQLKAEGTNRYELGRDKFLEKAWQWKAQSKDTIVNQLKRLGLSADWSRERFTLDETLCQGVIKAFIQLYQDGLIYRGNYLVNWCPESQSAVSDLEVENKEIEGYLWHFRYPLTDGSGYLEVATTRPETMLGDTAVAVNPHDSRYQDLIGKTVTLPIMGREIPIIGDEFVDPEFGTGCVKVTPAHDPNDFAMGKRHQLPFINIMNKDGTLNENAGSFVGLDRFVARKKVVEQLEIETLLVKVEAYRHSIPYSDRGKVPVEPLLSTQWFVKIQPLGEKALSELDNHHSPQFVPERWSKVYRDWLVKLQDWCISRQLWWGHQIPAWYIISETNGQITDNTPFIVAHDETEAYNQAKATYGENAQLEQDPDVLDTWFSSGLWPFSTMGWPQETEDLAFYYPNSTLVTGFDIIFFWVARMTMMGKHFTGKIPFQDVYIHGLVRDENGKKMSKSANNGIDPLLLIDKYGTDALRFTLIKEVAGAGQDITLQYNRETDESGSVEASRNFANKLWNASRFVLMNLDGKTPDELGKPDLANLEICDYWLLSRFNQVVKETREYSENYGLGEAAKCLYEFIWGDFCDWYIELVKSRLREDKTSHSRLVAQQILAYVLEGILKLLHPFMPHITQEIWHNLTQKSNQNLSLQTYPQVDELLTKTEANHQDLIIATQTYNDKTSATISKNNWQIILNFILQLPQFFKYFWNKYQETFFFIGLVLIAFIALKIILTVAIAIHNLPLMQPTLRLIGLGYTIYFAYNKLLWANQREKVVTEISNIQKEVFGTNQNKLLLNPKKNLLLPPATKYLPIVNKPVQTLINVELETKFTKLIETIRTIRYLRAEAEIKPGVKIPLILQTENPLESAMLQESTNYIQDLAKVESLTITSSLKEEIRQAIAGVVGTIQILIPLSGLIDIDSLGEKLAKNLNKIQAEIKYLETRLENPNFIKKAPVEIVQNTKDNLAEAQKQEQIIQQRLQRLQ